MNGWADALVLVPYAALGLAGVLALVVGRLPRRAGLAVAIATSWCCWRVASLGGRRARPGPGGAGAEVDAVVDVLPDATMLSIQAPQPLVLAHRVNPSEHQMFRLGLETYVTDLAGGLAGYAAWIAKTRPTIVAVGGGAIRLADADAGHRLRQVRHQHRVVLVRRTRHRPGHPGAPGGGR